MSRFAYCKVDGGGRLYPLWAFLDESSRIVLRSFMPSGWEPGRPPEPVNDAGYDYAKEMQRVHNE